MGDLGKREQTGALGALVSEYTRSRVSRREFVRRAALLGVSVPAAASLLAAVTPAPVAAQNEPQTGGRFTWGYDRDVTKLDPVSSGWADPGMNAL